MATDEEHRYIDNVLGHKFLVGYYLTDTVRELTQRAVVHDFSKFGPDEFEPYASVQDRFAVAEYGSDEYKACCEAIAPALKHHVLHNSHHPEAHERGINDMSLFDIMEMVCDWCAACQRNNGTTLRLDLQKKRFGIDDQLYGIICETANILLRDDDIEIVK